jgi:hypothetical protein
MPEKSSRFQRVAYANRAASLADELVDWSRIYSSRSYGTAYVPSTNHELEQYAEKSEQLAELAMQLQRISIALLA